MSDFSLLPDNVLVSIAAQPCLQARDRLVLSALNRRWQILMKSALADPTWQETVTERTCPHCQGFEVVGTTWRDRAATMESRRNRCYKCRVCSACCPDFQQLLGLCTHCAIEECTIAPQQAKAQFFLRDVDLQDLPSLAAAAQPGRRSVNTRLYAARDLDWRARLRHYPAGGFEQRRNKSVQRKEAIARTRHIWSNLVSVALYFRCGVIDPPEMQEEAVTSFLDHPSAERLRGRTLPVVVDLIANHNWETLHAQLQQQVAPGTVIPGTCATWCAAQQNSVLANPAPPKIVEAMHALEGAINSAQAKEFSAATNGLDWGTVLRDKGGFASPRRPGPIHPGNHHRKKSRSEGDDGTVSLQASPAAMAAQAAAAAAAAGMGMPFGGALTPNSTALAMAAVALTAALRNGRAGFFPTGTTATFASVPSAASTGTDGTVPGESETMGAAHGDGAVDVPAAVEALAKATSGTPAAIGTTAGTPVTPAHASALPVASTLGAGVVPTSGTFPYPGSGLATAAPNAPADFMAAVAASMSAAAAAAAAAGGPSAADGVAGGLPGLSDLLGGLASQGAAAPGGPDWRSLMQMASLMAALGGSGNGAGVPLPGTGVMPLALGGGGAGFNGNGALAPDAASAASVAPAIISALAGMPQVMLPSGAPGAAVPGADGASAVPSLSGSK